LIVRESQFIEWIRRQSRFATHRVPIGPGDDCAAVRVGQQTVLVTTDQVLDGVHFRLAEHGPRAAGRKAMARNLSDVAAMAAEPVAAVASVALPRGLGRGDCEAIYHGLREAADPFDCPVVGGDVAAWDGSLAITVTVLARPGRIEPVRRSGAKPGQAICVTGSFGGAWRTKRHLEFTPRIAEARLLADRYELGAMIDVSDGLARDLAHVCEASGVGAELLAEAIPVHPDADVAGGDPLQAALGDGEDYELLFTLPGDSAESLLKDQPLEVVVTRIGTITDAENLILVGPDGSRRLVDPAGWEHAT